MVLSYYDSKAFGKVCYGFKRNNQGLVEIEINQAEVVRKIFKMYKERNSLEDIQEYLFQNFKTISILLREIQIGAEMF